MSVGVFHAPLTAQRWLAILTLLEQCPDVSVVRLRTDGEDAIAVGPISEREK